MTLTDRQILEVFIQGLSDSNGRKCGIVLCENGLVETRRVCGGRSEIKNGRVELHDTCGEPCTFVCDNSRKFSEAVQQVKLYDRLIEQAKKAKP